MSRPLYAAALAAGMALSGAAWASPDCDTRMSDWQPRDAVETYVRTLGVEVSRLRIDDGCYEVRGRDVDGNRIELKLDPATLALVGLEVRFRPGADPARYLPGARAAEPGEPAAPSENHRLLSPGTVPRVRNM